MHKTSLCVSLRNFPIHLFIVLLYLSREYDLKKTTTTMASGVWSKWGEWGDCTKTCGIGIQRRIRNCSYTGKVKALRCRGNLGQMTNCDTKISCPVHGGWTTWVAWKCTVTCGGGEGVQRRSCTNPKPMFGGKKCNGTEEETGKCNTQKCPDQEYHNLEKNEGDTVKITCSKSAVTKIYEEYPKTSLMWTKNGQVLKYDHERMDITPTELTIKKIKSFDNGVYVCSVLYAPEVVKPLTVTVVTAKSSTPDIKIPEEESINLLCHGSQLAKIYNETTQRWLLNGKEFKNFGSKSPVENTVFEIDEVKKNMSGTWSCRIRDKVTSREWTTNVVVVKVLPARNKIIRFLSNRNVLIAIGIVFFVTIMLVGTILGYMITKTRETFMEEFQKWNQIVKWEEIKAGGVPEWARPKEQTTDTEESESGDEARLLKVDEVNAIS